MMIVSFRPSLTLTVYLRGAGVHTCAWKRIEQALWARGWDTTRSRTEAFHRARGGVPVVFVDFSARLGCRDVVTVGRVRARYGQREGWASIGNLLPPSLREELLREGAPWLDRVVMVNHQEMDLPLVTGGDIPRPYRRDSDGSQVLDEQAIACAVADVIDD